MIVQKKKNDKVCYEDMNLLCTVRLNPNAFVVPSSTNKQNAFNIQIGLRKIWLPAFGLDYTSYDLAAHPAVLRSQQW